MALGRLSLRQDSWAPLALENSKCARRAQPLEGEDDVWRRERDSGPRSGPGLRLRGDAVSRPRLSKCISGPGLRTEGRASQQKSCGHRGEARLSDPVSVSRFQPREPGGPAAPVAGRRADSSF